MNQRILAKLRQYWRLIRVGEFDVIVRDVLRYIWSDFNTYCFSRDLTRAHEFPKAHVEFEIQKLTPEMMDSVYIQKGLGKEGHRELEERVRMWQTGIPTAYAAVSTGGHLAFIQWAISGSNADDLERHYGASFPRLQPDELLLDNGWMEPPYRGQRIMGEALSRIIEIAIEPGHRRAVSYVGGYNEASMRGLRSAGFELYMERTSRWRFGRLSHDERAVSSTL